jgi:uncharacterized transporter YbjL
MKKILNLLVLFLVSLPLRAQEVEMADKMRAEGKIYVVVAILVIILAGLIAFVVVLDRKATRLEKKVDELLKK